MRVANLGGRAVLVTSGGVLDLARASGGRFGPDPMAAFAAWDALVSWAAGRAPDAADGPLDPTRLGPPVPRPAKVFGVGLNYRDHAAEAGLEVPDAPLIFTKFPSCLTGPTGDVRLSSNRVDWEVELVVVIGRTARAVAERDAMAYVAGYTVGQDVSDRRLQFAGKPPQFSLGKSLDTFGPLGPAVVSLDEIAEPDDLVLRCDVNGERMQDGRTRDMIFPVASLIAYLSRHVPLEPGDLVFTGTPAGIGSVRTPRRYLAPGDLLVSTIEGVGTLRNRCVA
jgi:2,4-didehydro-3-deoxy-L-rhamnonate hydrolase